MATTDPNLHYDYKPLVTLSKPELLFELAETHSAISNLLVQAGFLRQEELRGNQSAKELRLETEALKDAYIEKKWLLTKILEYG
jgi:hypothetical protein